MFFFFFFSKLNFEEVHFILDFDFVYTQKIIVIFEVGQFYRKIFLFSEGFLKAEVKSEENESYEDYLRHCFVLEKDFVLTLIIRCIE